ncbi:FAD-dependent oxidoreductase [Glaciihabitans tibetensis]|uniref:FAD-dependent oxidoreductase n=1 Tax=Glaciihabitans tibetensis TaxID=1266600 RepID=UPI001C6307E0|nr:FAD-binding oxidoreductase [Glaciihabitans tibetensis]
MIGAGFYGLRIALHLESLGFDRVTVVEREPSVMERASLNNQARVHNGYHYPRSILTGYRSHLQLPTFADEFAEAMVDDFVHLYAIAKRLSKVNARQFELFAQRIGSPTERVLDARSHSFDTDMVEAVFRVREPAFDARILRDLLMARIAEVAAIEISTSTEVLTVTGMDDERVAVETSRGLLEADAVISATYSGINVLHRRSGLPEVPLQHEITEMALVEMPADLKHVAVTVMDGPFFSMMPFPSRGLHTLSHVRYTPHRRWRDGEGRPHDPEDILKASSQESQFGNMRADVTRFMPRLKRLEHVDSLWEVKTVLTRSDSDDSRPILFLRDHGITNYTCIMGSKLDNIYDVLQELSVAYGRQ